jgi:hypothetical protein
MTALNPNNTPRFKFGYTGGLNDHTFELRSHLSPAAIGAHVNLWLTALSPRMHAITLNTCQFAAAGSNIFNTVTCGFEGTVYGSGTPITQEAPNYIDFIGRSTGGRRTRITMFGVSGLGTDFRWAAGEDAAVDAAIALLVGFGSDLRAIDDIAPVWKPYANAGVNSHWTKATRP